MATDITPTLDKFREAQAWDSECPSARTIFGFAASMFTYDPMGLCYDKNQWTEHCRNTSRPNGITRHNSISFSLSDPSRTFIRMTKVWHYETSFFAAYGTLRTCDSERLSHIRAWWNQKRSINVSFNYCLLLDHSSLWQQEYWDHYQNRRRVARKWLLWPTIIRN